MRVEEASARVRSFPGCEPSQCDQPCVFCSTQHECGNSYWRPVSQVYSIHAWVKTNLQGYRSNESIYILTCYSPIASGGYTYFVKHGNVFPLITCSLLFPHIVKVRRIPDVLCNLRFCWILFKTRLEGHSRWPTVGSMESSTYRRNMALCRHLWCGRDRSKCGKRLARAHAPRTETVHHYRNAPFGRLSSPNSVFYSFNITPICFLMDSHCPRFVLLFLIHAEPYNVWKNKIRDAISRSVKPLLMFLWV